MSTATMELPMTRQTDPIKPHLWTVEEVAAYWRVHVKTVYRWIREKRIMHITVGSDYRIPHEQAVSGCPRRE